MRNLPKFRTFTIAPGKQVVAEVCLTCGCDDYHACPGGCSWVKRHLCSVCAASKNILVIAGDQDPFLLSKPSARQMILHSISEGLWGISAQGKFRKTMKRGDRLFFYAGGKRDGGASIVGSAIVAAKPQCRAWRGYSYRVPLTKIELFGEGFPIATVLKQLNLYQAVSNKRKWGCAIRGSRQITEVDALTLLKQGRKFALKSRVAALVGEPAL